MAPIQSADGDLVADVGPGRLSAQIDAQALRLEEAQFLGHDQGGAVVERDEAQPQVIPLQTAHEDFPFSTPAKANRSAATAPRGRPVSMANLRSTRKACSSSMPRSFI